MSVAAADEVRQQKCPDLFDFAAGGEARSHLAAAVAAIGIAPLLHGFFAIEEGDPDGIFSVLGAEQTGQLQHYGGWRTANICGPYKCLRQPQRMSAGREWPACFGGKVFAKLCYLGGA